MEHRAGAPSIEINQRSCHFLLFADFATNEAEKCIAEKHQEQRNERGAEGFIYDTQLALALQVGVLIAWTSPVADFLIATTLS